MISNRAHLKASSSTYDGVKACRESFGMLMYLLDLVLEPEVRIDKEIGVY